MRVSCTTIENFRLFMADYEWMTEDALIASIKGEVTDTPAMRLGRAFESVLMAPDTYRVPHGYQCDGYSFDDATMREPLTLIDPLGVFQVKAARPYGSIDVVVKADQLVGCTVQEWKTTCSSFDIEKYLLSCQPLFYLDVFEAARLTFHVFCLDDHANGVVDLRGIESFHVYPYPGLHADCAQLVDQFSAYVHAKGLDGLLRERQQKAGSAWAA